MTPSTFHQALGTKALHTKIMYVAYRLSIPRLVRSHDVVRNSSFSGPRRRNQHKNISVVQHRASPQLAETLASSYKAPAYSLRTHLWLGIGDSSIFYEKGSDDSVYTDVVPYSPS